MASQQLFQAPVLLGNGITLFGRGREHFFQTENLLLERLDVHLLAFTVCPGVGQHVCVGETSPLKIMTY